MQIDPACRRPAPGARRRRGALVDGLGPYSALVQALQQAVGRNFNWVRDVTVSNSTWGNRSCALRFACRRACAGRRHRPGPGHGHRRGHRRGGHGIGQEDLHLAGDGGFILNLGELATAVQERADMVIVLMNDKGYGVIKNIQDAQYGGRRHYVDLHTPDYAQLCQSLALRHRRVSNLADIGAALDDATAPGPFLLEIDMLSIGSFKTVFAGPPVNKLAAIANTAAATA
jgi:acetolactate synthase-1/2/3 large subunit